MSSIAVCASPRLVSIAAHGPSVNRRASPAAVVEDSPAIGASRCPTVSARCRSSPTNLLAGQLRAGRPDQQLATGQPSPAGLDRSDPGVQSPDHTQAIHQLRHSDHPRDRGQIRIRRGDPHPASGLPNVP
jgi:hypothetical protein